MASRLAGGNLPLATPGWFETTTTGKPSSFNLRTAAAAPGRSLNSSADRGESGPSGLTTIWLITPSRSRKTALVMLDPLPEGVHHQVVEEHVDALDDRGAELVDEDGDRQVVVGHLGHGAAVESTESDHGGAGIPGGLHGAHHVLRPGSRAPGARTAVDRE